MRWIGILGLFGLLAGCVETTTGPVAQAAPAPRTISDARARIVAEQAARQFVEVVARVEPVAERECRRRTPQFNCNFQIVVDDRPNQPPNAFQTLDRNGRPIIAFTLPLILAARNSHELAFVMGHEAAHHISGHLERTRQNATLGAVIASGIAAATGADSQAIQSAQKLGAQLGARSYSKEFELEADMLGTVIAKEAGYDPLIGVKFFSQIPDPGNRFLGTHPPNAKRVAVVQRTAAAL